MTVLTIAGVWVGLSLVAVVLFSRFVHFSESAAVATPSRVARRAFALRGGRSANSRARIFSRAANHSASLLRWREARAVRRHAQPAIRKVG
jgi:hypothetical protein